MSAHKDLSTAIELVCCLISGIVSACCFRYLWAHRKTSYGRLIWVQLFALGLADIIYCFYTVLFAIVWCLAGNRFEYCLLYNAGVMPLRNILEFFSCVVEVHIAMGFAVACHGYMKAVTWLFYSFPICFLVTGGMYWYVLDEFTGCTQTHPFRWAGVIFGCCCMATLVYLTGICHRGGGRVRRRAVARGFSYLGSFLLTLGSRSAWMVMGQPKELDTLTLIGVNLNGGVIMGVYMWWMLQRPAVQEEAMESNNVSVVENWVLERYFDLSFQVDETVSSAARLVAESVLEAEKLRHCFGEELKSSPSIPLCDRSTCPSV